MAYNHFDYVPSSISKNRSIFAVHKAIAGGCEIGYLYPMCEPFRMLPGSSLKLDLAMEIRSGALIAPLQDSIQVDVFAFKVPNRIVWEHWKQFLGAVDDVLFDNLVDYEIPNFAYVGLDSSFATGFNQIYVQSHLLATWFELPSLIDPSNSDTGTKINALPFRGYTFIWNEFFRPEQLVDPILFSKTDVGESGQNMMANSIAINFNGITLNVISPNVNSYVAGVTLSGGVVLPTFRVHKSLWTSCLPKPSLETLNLLGDLQAPVGAFLGDDLKQAKVGGTTNYPLNLAGQSSSIVNQPVVADLSQAILTVNNYRETIMLQNYYDALNRAGSRYDELLRNLFHTNSPEAIIDIPELVVHKRYTVFRKDVVATANSADASGETQPLGSQASYIDTVVRDSFFTTSTSEHGFVHLLFTIRPSIIRMGNGFSPMWKELTKFAQYYPQFDGMGDVPRFNDEIVAGQSGIFGYQEYGAQYKYFRSSAVGWANPNLTNHIPGLTLCETPSSVSLVPSQVAGLGSYISCIEDEAAFARCLAITDPQIAPQFIVDIRLDGEIVHPMPVYNVPGMGDLL